MRNNKVIATIGYYCRDEIEGSTVGGGVSLPVDLIAMHSQCWQASALVPSFHPGLLYECRESMHFDLLVVGAGPSGLAAAIRFKQVSRVHAARGMPACSPGLGRLPHAATQAGVRCTTAAQLCTAPCSFARRGART